MVKTGVLSYEKKTSRSGDVTYYIVSVDGQKIGNAFDEVMEGHKQGDTVTVIGEVKGKYTNVVQIDPALPQAPAGTPSDTTKGAAPEEVPGKEQDHGSYIRTQALKLAVGISNASHEGSKKSVSSRVRLAEVLGLSADLVHYIQHGEFQEGQEKEIEKGDGASDSD